MSTKHTPGPDQKPWGQMTAEERADAYFDASLRIHDIDWYRFHGVDPRDAQGVAAGSRSCD